ncbi:MAG: hypothetical protein AAGO57_00195 [Pseudomonadota bacterium]
MLLEGFVVHLRFLFFLFLSVLLPLKSVAQDGSWVYLGLPQDFQTTEKILTPSVVCVRQGWTVENSGLDAIAATWGDVRSYSPPDVAAVVEAAATRQLPCHMLVVLRSMLLAQPQISRRITELGYVNLSESLTSAMAQPAPAEPSPVQPSRQTQAPQVQLSAERAAQIKQFVYLGHPRNFESRDDISDARLCLLGSWSPQKSGLGAFADGWGLQARFPMSEMFPTVSAFASNFWNCTILIIPRSALEGNAELLNDVVRSGLVDLTDAILPFASDRPAKVPEEPNPAEVRANANLAYKSFLEICPGRSLMSTYTNCDCMAAKVRDDILTGKRRVTQQSAKNLALNYRSDEPVSAACINDAAISKEAAEKQAKFFQVYEGVSPDDPIMEPFKACVGEREVQRFRRDPRLDLEAISKGRVEAGRYCQQQQY